MEGSDPAKDDRFERKASYPYTGGAVREGGSADLRPSTPGRHRPSVQHTNELADDLIVRRPILIAYDVGRQDQGRLTIPSGKQGGRRDMISVPVVFWLKGLRAQVAEG